MTNQSATSIKSAAATPNDSPGILYGVGVGPGDPMLMTLKAHELIQQAAVVSYLANAEGQSQARTIAQVSLHQRLESLPNLIEVPIPMPMSTDRTLANQAYDKAANQLTSYLRQGLSVVFLCEGDPLFFGSFAYLLRRLQGQFTCQIVPGVASIHASAAALQSPLTLQEDSLVVASGRHTDEQLQRALLDHDSVVIMKAGRARPRILRLLRQTGRWQDASYVEYVGREQELIVRHLDQLVLAQQSSKQADTADPMTQPGPYFSLFIVVKNRTDKATVAASHTEPEQVLS